MSKQNESLVKGIAVGLGLAGVGLFGIQFVRRMMGSEGSKEDVKKESAKKPVGDGELVPRSFTKYSYIQTQISQVCQVLEMNELYVLQKYFPHVLSLREFEIDVSELTPEKVSEFIDHTQLKTTSTKEQIEKLCDEAVAHNFASVCVNGNRVKHCSEYSQGKLRIAAVIGFPLGCMTTESKIHETLTVFRHGAQEIDMVICVGKLKEGDYQYVYRDIKAVCDVKSSRVVKVILETCYLEPKEIILGCILSVLAGAKYVKTSTGFGTSGAKPEHVRLMKKVVGSSAKVKAAGGIRCFKDAVNMIEAGASRLGCSAGVKIVKMETANSDY